jgi:hypothetical protein
MSNKTKILIVAAIIIAAAASRLVKHPFNFTPVVAMALFAGCYLQKRWALVLPLAAMFVSDFFLGFYDWQVMASVYVSIALAFFIGWYLRNRVKWYSVTLAALASSLTFFIITNFAVWAFFAWYPHTWAGLVSCFTLALPFFRNTLIGDLVYSGVFFGAYELVMYLNAKRALAVEKI